jgi:hypothetical protein
MFGGFPDSTLGSWSFWLQVLGIAGALGVVVSLVGMHLVSSEISARAGRSMVAPVEHLAASVSAVQMAAAPARVEEKAPPKVAIALSKPPVAREITEAQRAAFIDELIDAPKSALPVIVCEQDPEILAYADQIRVMLVLAGYDAGPTVKTNPTAISPVGVSIVVKDPARAPRLAGAIQNAFKAIGIVALGAKDDYFEDDQVAVIVGRKN